MFSSMPTLPSQSKWTKTGPAGDFCFSGYLFGILFHLLDKGMKGYHQTQKVYQADEEAPDPDGDDGDWHAVAGKRLSRTKATLSSKSRRIRHIIFMIVSEPLRILTSYFLQISASRVDYKRAPPLFNLLWNQKSILTAALEYLSSMLSGNATRLKLVWQLCGEASSWIEWIASDTENAAFLRRCILYVASAIWRRHVHPLQRRGALSVYNANGAHARAV
jgi:hypothetical protein